MDIKLRIKEVLEQGYLMSLGTIDDGGVWVSDVIYVSDEDFNIYWMSDPEVRHSKAIMHNEKVAGTITLSNKCKEDNLGVQIEGKALKIEGERFDLAKKHYFKRGKESPKEDQGVLDGDSWYMLKPSMIELIDEKNFGFDKQKVISK